MTHSLTMRPRIEKSSIKMTQIKKLNQTTFYLETCKNRMMLTQRKTCYGKVWEMYIDNASRRTKKSLAVKEFDTLKEVENYYKSWSGLCLISRNE